MEGDSAAGPAKAGRNSENMAILPLRGKVVNAGKATMQQVIDNAEAQALITAIGAGSGKEFNLDDARYGRIIILHTTIIFGGLLSQSFGFPPAALILLIALKILYDLALFSGVSLIKKEEHKNAVAK